MSEPSDWACMVAQTSSSIEKIPGGRVPSMRSQTILLLKNLIGFHSIPSRTYSSCSVYAETQRHSTQSMSQSTPCVPLTLSRWPLEKRSIHKGPRVCDVFASYTQPHSGFPKLMLERTHTFGGGQKGGLEENGRLIHFSAYSDSAANFESYRVN